MEQLLKRVINCVKKVNKVKAVSFTDRLNGIIDRYNDRSDDIVLADEIVSEVASQLADLFEEIKRDSHLPDGIPDIEVKLVDQYPGFLEFKEVDSYPDFTIRIVKEFADIEVKVVKEYPSIRRF